MSAGVEFTAVSTNGHDRGTDTIHPCLVLVQHPPCPAMPDRVDAGWVSPHAQYTVQPLPPPAAPVLPVLNAQARAIAELEMPVNVHVHFADPAFITTLNRVFAALGPLRFATFVSGSFSARLADPQFTGALNHWLDVLDEPYLPATQVANDAAV